jgi:CheY-like chemotaxis protein
MRTARRRYPRIEVAAQVRVVDPSGPSWTGQGQDLSPFGMKVRGGHVHISAVARLEFDLPGDGPPVAIRALALRNESDGIAFAFVDLAREQFHLVRQAVDGLLLSRKLWIMIVERDQTTATALAEYVERAGHTALVIERAEEALAYLAHDHVDAIMLDLDLPGMTGLELLEALAERTAQIPVVVVSAAISETDAARCLRLGALDFVATPFTAGQLERTVSALSLKGLEERLSG